ncbi:phosphoenolpyruvate--protein phosphotransferase [Methylobacterium sp. J-059]|uniref:phosphoenolpyruvate--protein phosphotransferase n=1 Tax=Methylobacterium sp. J-059 TaxID=2836643 RepID=UPI001FBBBEBE|nr:phosphoenolpyruvate--protein phosphotransferase [Methylobacterium sp. J-059]MCJ2041737.1 phosphoenolpyruvate--protein phosphotransferase [Methylobacterium sp. J-059]
MPAAPGGPRLLLRRLREAMAEPVSPQARLDRIVVVIAANVIAEVCSVYVLRDDNTLELFATEGLNREAVHLTRMRADEGLVGLIAQTAEPLSLSDAQTHPAFSYRPETGEEAYHAFLGVPLLRAGNTLGVLTVQNKTYRVYSDEEIEALQTTAMVLSEMIASGELQGLAPDAGTAARRAVNARGVVLADGIGLGHVVLHEPRIVVKTLIAENVEAEIARLEAAIEAVRSAIDDLVERGDKIGTGESREVLETVRMFAHDKGWLRRMREAVVSGLTAEAAVERVQSDNRARMMRQSDPYLRDRLHDLDDLANRLLRRLTGQEGAGSGAYLPDNAILVARSMGPAALLDYDPSRLRGVVLEEGGPTSHIAIVARALGIPAVGEVENATALCDSGDAIIVDGVSGEVQVRPGPEIEAAYAEMVRLRAKRQEQYRALRDVPATTRDGIRIGLHLNAGLLVDLGHLNETGAEGIGLFRTELQFMVAQRMPSAAEQQALYEAVFAATGDRPVTIRTLDIGGDKILPYMPKLEEENPALGWRAIRIGLDRPALLRVQLRALLRAAAGRPLKIMFPMVATVDEFVRAKAIVDREKAHLRRHGHPLPSDCRLGAMVEVPSLLFQIDEIAQVADFLSVGSNDLMQFLFAVDRENRRVADRFDPLCAAAIRAFRLIAERADAAGCPVTVCGEIGGRPLEAMALIGMGFRDLSMSPASIGPIKAMVLSLDARAIADVIDAEMARAHDGASIRPALAAFAKTHGIPV